MALTGSVFGAVGTAGQRAAPRPAADQLQYTARPFYGAIVHAYGQLRIGNFG